jgi:carboxymethylenebutenolidase
MIEVLLLLAAASPGGESTANLNPTIAPAVIAEAPVPDGVRATDVAGATHRPNATARPWLSDDADLNAVLSKVSDAYDVPPAVASPKTTPRQPLGPHLVRSDEHYKSQGRNIEIEVLRPDDDRQRPAILILHGASGIGDGAFYRGAAETFAGRGYVTFLPHYLPRQDQKRAAKAKESKASGGKPAASAEESVLAGLPVQDKILRDAVDFMARSSYVDASRIGVFGLSLGAFHALNLSSTDQRIAAVVDMSGGLRGNMMPESNRLPPTLALHGAHDPLVSVSRARSLATYLKERRIPHQLVVYPDQGHFFRGRAQEDAIERSVSFLGRYLHPMDSSWAAQSREAAE